MIMITLTITRKLVQQPGLHMHCNVFCGLWPNHLQPTQLMCEHGGGFSGPCSNIKMPSYRCRKLHCEGEIILWPSYLRDGHFIQVRRHLYIETGPRTPNLSPTPASRWFICMVTSSNGNIYRVTGPLCGKFTGHRWIPLTKSSDAELRWFFLSEPEQTAK